ncbi:MAG: spore coat associated protein CotJA [Clostridiaceae bacterium]|nr:spore coat associated protein CotJA [Clostridiaceae bacterium]
MPFQHVQPMPGMPCMPGQPCIPQETVIRNVKLANAYVPFQNMCNLFSPIEGLKKGTIFPELYSPYTGVDKRSRPPEYE